MDISVLGTVSFRPGGKTLWLSHVYSFAVCASLPHPQGPLPLGSPGMHPWEGHSTTVFIFQISLLINCGCHWNEISKSSTVGCSDQTLYPSAGCALIAASWAAEHFCSPSPPFSPAWTLRWCWGDSRRPKRVPLRVSTRSPPLAASERGDARTHRRIERYTRILTIWPKSSSKLKSL